MKGYIEYPFILTFSLPEEKHMRYAIRLFFSIPVLVVLILTFILAIAAATFIETIHGADTARALVYNAGWMTALYLFITLHLIVHLVRFRLWRKGKRAVFLLHAGFLVLLSGAAITRFAGFEGRLHFREGETTNRMLSSRAFLRMEVREGDQTVHAEKKLLLSAVTPNRIRMHARTGNRNVRIALKSYYPAARPVLIEDESGGPVLALSVTSGEMSGPVFLRDGGSDTFQGWTFAFHGAASGARPSVAVRHVDGELTVTSNRDLEIVSMRDGTREFLPAGESSALTAGTLFVSEAVRFALQQFVPSGRIGAVPSRDRRGEDAVFSALVVEVVSGDFRREAVLFGGSGAEGEPEILREGDLEVTLRYGAKPIVLPFSLTLKEFRIDRYPGSRMPSGYTSEVIVRDPDTGIAFPFQIYMNHILRYRGYRFFQSSYDTDEKGSILSVSCDPGTAPTYAGYALVSLGLVFALFAPAGRFRRLGRSLRGPGAGAAAILVFALFVPASAGAAGKDEALQFMRKIDDGHAKAFGGLIVQDARGRMKPVNSLAHEWMRRLGRPEKAAGVSPDAFLLAVFTESVPFFAEDDPRRQEAVALLRGGEFRLFPLPGAPDRVWHAENEPGLSADAVVQELVRSYRAAVLSAVETGEWREADGALARIDAYQRRHGEAVFPPEHRILTEILYNNLNIFQRLGVWLPVLGGAMILLILAHLIFGRAAIGRVVYLLSGVLLACFFLQTVGLALRWIASGHAPWANKYESMIYIAWATLLAGILFAKNARLAFGGGAFLSGLILRLAHTPGFDPKMTDLPPVLKSHWLITHVSVITSSYGFFGLAALLGLFVLLFFALSGRRNQERFRPAADRLAVVTERSMWAGLTLVTIGNFLGAVWANESWGRYWGWDPKETWTLVIILSYALVLHLRLVPGWGGVYGLSAGAVLAFLTVLMTYFGVNLYLSGLHSYAGGEAPQVPAGLFIGLAGLFVLIAIAGIREKRSGRGRQG